MNPQPPFEHLARLTSAAGIFEHAELAIPRPEHGYCADDAARLLVVCCREPDPSVAVRRMAGVALRFLSEAQSADGAIRNRRGVDERWHGAATTEDAWGRAMWGFGCATGARDEWMRQTGQYCFERGAHQRSPWPRAMAFAALGAAQIARTDPGHRTARALLADAIDVIGAPRPGGAWLWPEARLTYANAVLPNALLAAGTALDRPDAVADGLALLGWLVTHETCGDHLSVTPVGGAGPDDMQPAFDQQPIEAAAIADACARAAGLDDDPRWSRGVADAVAWFLGANDVGACMWDPATGGGFDGLHADRPNQNQGAESTLALVSTLQHARWLVAADR